MVMRDKIKAISIFAVISSLLSLPFAIATEVPVTATVSGYVALTFTDEYSAIGFGPVAQNSNNNAGGNNTYYNITVTTNGVAEITFAQGDLTGAGTINDEQVKMTNATDTPASTNPATATAMGSDIVIGSLSTGAVVYANYWLDVPALQTSGAYSGTQTITATAS